MIRRILAGLGKILKWGFVTLGMAAIVVLAINAADESPSAELKALLAVPRDSSGTSNGYLGLVGVAAPSDENALAYGARWVDTYNSATSKRAIEKAGLSFPATVKVTFRGDQKQLCNPAKMRCLAVATNQAEAWRGLATNNETLLARQRSLAAYGRFEESYFMTSIESPIPLYGDPSRLLLLDLIALDAAEGRLEQALATLESRIAFDRRALLGSRILITGMVATSWLRQDYALLAEIVAAHPGGLAKQRDRLRRMTEPLEVSEVRAVAGRLIEGEYRYLARSMPSVLDSDNVDAWSVFLMRPFFKLNASRNLVAGSHAALQARIASFSPENADAWIAEYRQAAQRERDAAANLWRMPYNPVGKFGFSITMPEYDRYVLRLSDMIGISRLARLQVEAVTTAIAGDDPLAIIVSSSPLYDPYSGKPMGWDASRRQIYFDARGDYPKGTTKRFEAGV